MPLDEQPNLVSLLLAVERSALDEVYRALGSAGHQDLAPASAAVFQHIRPGGSELEELARLSRTSTAAIEEQARAMEQAGYVRAVGNGRIALTARGEAAVATGMAALAGIEARWREQLGESAYAGFATALARLNLGR